MVFKNTDMHTMLAKSKGKTLICFGAGRRLAQICDAHSDKGFFDRIDLIADNDKTKYSFTFSKKTKTVAPIEQCLKQAKKPLMILITVTDFFDIAEQLDRLSELAADECYIYSLIEDAVAPYSLPMSRCASEPGKIPKIIHYCWFGGAPIPRHLEAFMDTWKRFCPDYTMLRWDESNYDYNKNAYMRQAYEHKKWAFVTDYARLDIVYQHGGVYLDTDVELIKNLDDLLCDDAFCGFQERELVNTGLGYGAVAGFPFFGEMLEVYDNASFVNDDGSLNYKPAPHYLSELFSSRGGLLNNTLQCLDGMTVYPSDVLSPLDHKTRILCMTENTHAIHHYKATWYNTEQRKNKDQLINKYHFLAEAFNRG